MRQPSKALAWVIATAMSTMVHSFSPPHPTLTDSMRPAQCGLMSSNSSLKVCVSVRKGVARYEMDTLDGTHAEFALTKDAVELQQAGPDGVRVVTTHAPATSSSGASPAEGLVSRAYMDERLEIDEVQDGYHAPIWVIYPRASPAAPSLLELCEGAGCSGGIQQPY